jgi:ribosomal protein S18 acetylase RimI-like enzyme
MTYYYAIGMPKITDIIELYESVNFNRPTKDIKRFTNIITNSNLLVCALEGEKLVGFARCLTDRGWSCYLADLVVHKDYHRKGIGKGLVKFVRNSIGPECMLLLLAAPSVMKYYPYIGFRESKNAFFIPRKY